MYLVEFWVLAPGLSLELGAEEDLKGSVWKYQDFHSGLVVNLWKKHIKLKERNSLREQFHVTCFRKAKSHDDLTLGGHRVGLLLSLTSLSNATFSVVKHLHH